MNRSASGAEPVTVWKVGGSLLTLPDLPERLETAMTAAAALKPLIVVGGGDTADLVRRWDRIHGLGEERAHWLALESLGLNELLLTRLLRGTTIVETRRDAARAWAEGRWPILHAVAFVTAEEPAAAVRLPHCWDVTSDSVAAWVAAVWPAAELVLVKSTSLPAGSSVAEAASRGLVDAWLPQIASRVPSIRWIDLRSDPMHVTALSERR